MKVHARTNNCIQDNASKRVPARMKRSLKLTMTSTHPDTTAGFSNHPLFQIYSLRSLSHSFYQLLVTIQNTRPGGEKVEGGKRGSFPRRRRTRYIATDLKSRRERLILKTRNISSTLSLVLFFQGLTPSSFSCKSMMTHVVREPFVKLYKIN